ncbi:hypothetical protein BC831DRAFT_458987, partial [Entophlyctis helioformis]
MAPENHSRNCDVSDDDDVYAPADMFEEPEGFRPPSPQPTTTSFARIAADVEPGTPTELVVHLVGKHSLWGHWLWNAGKSMTQYLDKNKDLVRGKAVVELGAAAALPSIVASLDGARKVVSTDYPDPQLLTIIRRNAEENAIEKLRDGSFVVEGYIWGDDPAPVLAHLSDDGSEKFDVVLLADVIFNHNQHNQLLKSCRQLLAPGGIVLTTFTHHVVKWADRDMKFFDIADELGYKHEKLYQERWECMFPKTTVTLKSAAPSMLTNCGS